MRYDYILRVCVRFLSSSNLTPTIILYISISFSFRAKFNNMVIFVIVTVVALPMWWIVR